MHTVKPGALLLLLLFYASCLVVQARSIRVPYDYPTIREACQVAQAGDSVTVYPGYYYDEHVSVPPGVAVIGMGATPEQVQVMPPEFSLPFYVEAGEAPALIENLTAYEGFYGVIWNHNPQLLVRRCHLLQTDGRNVITTWTGFEMRECWIEFYASEYAGWATFLGQVNVLVEDCVFLGFPWVDEWSPEAGSSLEFRNNTFVGGFGVAVPAGESRDFALFVVNNIMTWGASCGARYPFTMEWRYNDFVRPDFWPWCGYQIGNFSEDPLFCDPDALDYRLDPDSPCIGAGEGGEDVGARLGICWPQDIEDYLPQRTGDLLVSGPWPNPTTGGVRLIIQAAGSVPVNVDVLDPTGSLVRRLAASNATDSRGSYWWDGRTAHGSLAPSGVYYLRVKGAAEGTPRRVIVLR